MRRNLDIILRSGPCTMNYFPTLPTEVYSKLAKMHWFSEVGRKDSPQFDYPVGLTETQQAAIEGFNSALWADVKTEAQGDLTSYLAKHHMDSYGGWNNLANQSRDLVKAAVDAELSKSIVNHGFPLEMLQPIIVDLNRAAIEIAYRGKFPKAPMFFERLLRIYESGRLPCGWDGKIRNWPRGNIIAF